MRPTRRTIALLCGGLAVALLPSVGLASAWPATLVFWAVMLPLLCADALACPRRDHFSWSLDAPELLHVGVTRSVTLSARLPQRWAGRLEATLDVTEPLAPLTPGRARGSAGRAELRWDLRSARRGVARLETLWMRFDSPLGLWQRWLREAIDCELPVLPDVPLVKAEALRFFSDREFRLGLKTERYQGEGSEFDSLKEFVAGDDRRAIDWKSTARHRKLLARQPRAERDHNVMLTVDTGRLMSEPLGTMTRLDHALHGGLRLAHACLRTGDRVGLFTFDARARLVHAPSGGLVTLQPLIAGATRVRYVEAETNFTLALTQLSQHLARRSLIVLLTEFSDTVSAELMLENVGRLVRRHELIFVTIRDPLLDGIVQQAPDSHEALSAITVAQGLQRERERVHLDLRRLGVHVLDVPPQRIAADLIREYLDIRRRERI